MNVQERDGHIMISPGTPVYSRREYVVRKYIRSAYDAYDPMRPPNATDLTRDYSQYKEPAIIFEDKETGLLTTNVVKFEAWLYAGEKEEDR